MPPQRSTLQELLNYVPEDYLTKDELALIKNTFKDSPQLFKVLRKVFIPTVSDPDLPIEQFGLDAWLVDKAWDSIPDHEIKPIVLARQDALKFIMGGLIKLKILASGEEEAPELRKERLKKDSNK